jgi:protoporphyrinogen oxidase
MKIVILGAGPTGLGAAWRLQELGHKDWEILDLSPSPGGLSRSFVDDKGFTWDIGGHVQFSHYEYFDRVMDILFAPEEWQVHQREAWVWMRDRFIPYPLQNNLWQLPMEEVEKCLLTLPRESSRLPKASSFRQWILATFGEGLAESFFFPYNAKVWGYPPEVLSAEWVGDRVSVPDFARVLHHLLHRKPDVSWGPNRTFRYPVLGGTGEIWRRCAAQLPREQLVLSCPETSVLLDAHVLFSKDDRFWAYDALINTVPLDMFVTAAGGMAGTVDLSAMARELGYSSSNIVGIGLRGSPPPELVSKCWIYFPEDKYPFYRVTVFSNYAKTNAPDGHWSLIAEVSESSFRPVNQANLLERVITGLVEAGLVKDWTDVVSTWRFRAEHGYPTPVLFREELLGLLLPILESYDVYSRGRFGAWRYEVSNQDHAFMQGVEAADRLVLGREEMTYCYPNTANSRWQGLERQQL